MKLTDLAEIIWRNLLKRKGRTFLTMLGVIIGSIAIYVIISLGNGFEKYMSSQLNSFGDVNIINIFPYSDSTTTYQGGNIKNRKKILNDKTLKELNKLEFVKYSIPKLNTNADITYKKSEMKSSNLTGMSFKNYSKDHELLFGKYPNDSKNEVVIGYKLAAYLINKKDVDNVKEEEIKKILRKKLKVKVSRPNEKGEEEWTTYTVKVSGICKENFSDDYQIKAPLSFTKDILTYKNNDENFLKNKGYESIDLVLKSQEKSSQAEKYLKDNGYLYQSLKEMQNSISKTLSGIKLILSAIGGISLLVAAFGIANTMNMSILERKKEIGVMKVVGASIGDIKKIFIGEATAIGFSGGVVGLLIGSFISFVINTMLKSKLSTSSSGDVKIAVSSIGLVTFVLFFSSCVGFLSGLYPASKAAKLDVISSIKDE
ncbi:ABC transporter permease [Clostridium botulinum A2 117]|uniref:ABC transporter permease n=1 Tax=Clostridium botulinum TaxID=1491 RepID=UPI0007DECC42|nr:FtsX-like permease family protein [Clostridium botulinum]KEI78210.1 ABC transporter permease [Clostridium botulinum A2 117]MBN3415405.1 ABC transporter permease [Clostridium botulinum]MBN3441698.1 ABC transporter permease [Clostridium botulinum]MBY6805754.1 ABC transporter permease [Clostridium botulinum]